MKVDPYLHAVLLLHGAGKEITAESIAKVVESAGVKPDEARAKVLADAVKDVNFEELLTTPALAVQPAAQPQQTEEKKEEKKEEEKPKEEDAAAGLASLFG